MEAARLRLGIGTDGVTLDMLAEQIQACRATLAGMLAYARREASPQDDPSMPADAWVALQLARWQALRPGAQAVPNPARPGRAEQCRLGRTESGERSRRFHEGKQLCTRDKRKPTARPPLPQPRYPGSTLTGRPVT